MLVLLLALAITPQERLIRACGTTLTMSCADYLHGYLDAVQAHREVMAVVASTVGATLFVDESVVCFPDGKDIDVGEDAMALLIGFLILGALFALIDWAEN